DGAVTLRAALERLSATAADDVQIFFDPAVFNARRTITLSKGQLNFVNSPAFKVRVIGPAAGLTIDGGSAYRILDVITGDLQLENLTFTGGNAFGASPSTARGGAVLNEATLTVKSCLFLSNKARDAGGAIYNADSGELKVYSSTFYGNRVTAGDVDGSGGAVASIGQAELIHDTVVNNTAFKGGGIAMDPAAGHAMTVGNSIIQGNVPLLAGQGQSTGTIGSAGKNVVEDASGTTGWGVDDFLNQRVPLYPLGDFGGPSLSMPPVEFPDNVAIDGGNLDAVPAGLLADQRGNARVFSVGVDIGAVEVQEHISVSAVDDQTAATGAPQSFTFGIVTGRGSVAPWTVDIDWGDGSDHTQVANVTNAIPTQSHGFGRPGVYTVTAVATDANNLRSNPSTFRVTVTGNGNADGIITPGISTLKLPPVVVPGEKGSASVSLLNSGTQKATGQVELLLYLSADTLVDAADVPLAAVGRVGQTSIPAGGSAKLARTFVIPQSVEAGNYHLLAVASAADGFVGSLFSASPAVSAGTFQVVRGFGQVGDRKGVKLVLSDSDGTAATFSLSGPGSATLIPSSDSTPSILLADTTDASKLSVATKAGDRVFAVRHIVSEGVIGTVTGKSVNVVGNVILRGGGTSVTLADLVGGNQVSISGTTPATLKLGNVKNVTIDANAAIKSLTLSSWTDDDFVPDVITAPGIGTLKVAANFQPGLTLTGSGDAGFVALRSAAIKGGVGEAATWRVDGTVASLSVGGSVPVGFSANIKGDLNALKVLGDYAGELAAANVGSAVFKSTVSGGVLLAGADFGDDGVFAGSDNTYAAGTIRSLSVAGGVTGSTFAAGADLNANTLIAGGKIAAAAFKGTLSDDSRVVAEGLPPKVKVNGAAVDPVLDPRFH
ncbi:MAG TPA: choice-of-anchor Q domain-containing protein, partial [Humisphaera sp.]